MFRNIYNYITGNTNQNPQPEPEFSPHPCWQQLNLDRAALEARDQLQNTPLLQSISLMDIDAMEEILRRGAYIEGRGNNGFTPLAAAAFMGFVPGVQLLISRNANLEAISLGEIQRNPLGWAVHEGHAEVVRLLIAAGANPNIADSTGHTPARLAEILGHADCLHYLQPIPAPAPEVRREAASIGTVEDPSDSMEIEASGDDEDEFWIDPISMTKFESPITVPSGHTFSRNTLAEWFKQKGNPETIPCPMTRIPIPVEALTWGRNNKILEAMSLNLQPAKPELNVSDVRRKRIKFFEQKMDTSNASDERRKLASQGKM